MEPKKILNRDIIKYIAMFTMLLNHIGNIFFDHGTWPHIILVSIGYFTAPTMIYFLVEGYGYTRSKQKYLQRLILFALISQVPFSLAFSENGKIEFDTLNMMFTLSICFLLIYGLDIEKNRMRRSLMVAAAILASVICDWPVLAPAFTVIFITRRENEQSDAQSFITNTLLFGVISFFNNVGQYSTSVVLSYTICGMIGVAMSGVCLTYFYNGKRMEKGRNFSKWFFYLFYPVHLLILGLIHMYI